MNTVPLPDSDPASPADKTAIVGMGKTGISIARFLSQRGIVCEGFDEHPVQVPENLDIPIHIGRLKGNILAKFERVIASPGINLNHPALNAAREAKVPVSGDLDLFSEAFEGDLIAITGTNGKTTTVSLIATLMDTLAGGIEAGGNIGRPMLDIFEDAVSARRIVLELSSFQLERAKNIHPKWAALLNVQPDHADMHTDDVAYEAAKLRLFQEQGPGDTAMLPVDLHWDDLSRQLADRDVRVHRFGYGAAEHLCAGIQELETGDWQVFWRHGDQVEYIKASELPARGKHQHMNLAIAAQAAADFGVSPSVIRLALTSFHGLSHRLQSLGVIEGREWFDDSKATNPDAAKAALEAFDQVVWICGGLSKGVDLSTLQESVSAHVAQAYVIGKDPKPYAELGHNAGVPTSIAGTIEQAVGQAARAQPGLPVLLSPAAASQDQFSDYGERGNKFAEAVKKLEMSA